MLGSLTALIIVIAGVASASGKAKQADNASAVATTTPTRTATPSQAPTRHATSTGTVSTRATTAPAAPATTAPAAPATTAPAAPATTAPAAPATSAPAAPAGPTVSQQQALDSAQSYLALGSGFSRQGLIDQLDSPYGGKFSVADATWAADHAGADWDAQAVLAAKSYMQLGGFSRQSLIDQLDSPYGGKFTLAQATTPQTRSACNPAVAPSHSAAATSAGCSPLSDEGTCYEPGEYCRDADHGTSGVAGDGKAITCEDNDGWRWEPS